jgi:hypothetical protein
MRRREFTVALSGAALWPLQLCARQLGVPAVGFLSSGSADSFAHLADGFRQGLKAAGYSEGQNVAMGAGPVRPIAGTSLGAALRFF